MNTTRSRKQTNRSTPFTKALRLEGTLQRFLEKPPDKYLDRAIQRVRVLVQSLVMPDTKRCYFINHVRSCRDLYHAQKRSVTVYRMREIARKLQSLDRNWEGPARAAVHRPFQPRPHLPQFATA